MNNLEMLFNDLVEGRETVEAASQFMSQDPDIQKKIKYYCNAEYFNGLITEDSLQEISNIIKIAQFLYNYSGIETGLSDEEYDKLYEMMTDAGGKEIISVANNTILETCHHKYPSFRGTLDKVYYLGLPNEEIVNKSRRSLDQWIESTERDIYEKTGRHVDLSNAEIIVYPKFDGVSCIFEYNNDFKLQRVLTRGYTANNTATNIVHMFPKHKYDLNYMPHLEDGYAVKTEVMVSNDNLIKFNKKYGTDYKNTRSIASGILNSIDYDKEKCKFLEIIPLRYGDERHMYVCDEAEKKYPSLKTTLNDRKGIKEFADNLEITMPNLRCDGAVIKLLDKELVKILGIKDNKVKSEVAFKFTEVKTKSIIRNIEYQIGLFGNIAPVAIFDPVKLKGNTINKASLGSIGRLKSLDLSQDDEIIIGYDIVPYVSKDSSCSKSGKAKFSIPSTCPCCNSELKPKIQGSDELQCTNRNCKVLMAGKIINYASKLRILNISYATVNVLMDKGYLESISDLYTLYKIEKKISKLDGFGKKRVKMMLNSIDEHREVVADEFFGSLGIENASIKTFRKILSVLSYRDLIDLCCGPSHDLYCTLRVIDGIGDNTAMRLTRNLQEERGLILEFEHLMTVGEFKLYDRIISNIEPSFTVCFTKIRNTDIEKLITSKNGQVVDTVNKNTTYLVVPDLSISSSKVNKAMKNKVQIVTLDELNKILSKM